MKCPVCDGVQLTRGEYEGVNIERCPKCYGVLLEPRDRQAIERRQQLPADALLDEASLAKADDPNRRIDCPNCFRTISRESRDKPMPFTYDLCRRCDYAWFDVGEVALLQYAYEMRDQRIEATLLQERWKNMTVEERAAYHERVAKLPRGMGDVWFLDGAADAADRLSREYGDEF